MKNIRLIFYWLLMGFSTIASSQNSGVYINENGWGSIFLKNNNFTYYYVGFPDCFGEGEYIVENDTLKLMFSKERNLLKDSVYVKKDSSILISEKGLVNIYIDFFTIELDYPECLNNIVLFDKKNDTLDVIKINPRNVNVSNEQMLKTRYDFIVPQGVFFRIEVNCRMAGSHFFDFSSEYYLADYNSYYKILLTKYCIKNEEYSLLVSKKTDGELLFPIRNITDTSFIIRQADFSSYPHYLMDRIYYRSKDNTFWDN